MKISHGVWGNWSTLIWKDELGYIIVFFTFGTLIFGYTSFKTAHTLYSKLKNWNRT